MLKFNNGKFRILQISDIQETKYVSPDTVKLTRELIKSTEPDLIVLTGDQLKGYGIYMQMGDAKKNAKKVLSEILTPIKESGIPFTAVFGNHDVFGSADAEFQWSCYKECENFIGIDWDFDAVPVYSENGDEVKFCVYTFDSGLKKKGRYFPVKDEIIDKYKAKRDSFGKTVPALAFQHIPPADIYDCLEKAEKGTKGAFQGANSFAGKFYSLPSYAKNERSFMGENAASPDEKGTQVAALKEKGDVLGLFFGHDHNNSFVVKHEKLDLGYTQGIGFNIYGPGKNRGGRVFDIEENCPEKYTTFTVTAKDIEGFKLKRPVKEFIYTHSPSSISVALKWVRNVLLCAGAVALIIYILNLIF